MRKYLKVCMLMLICSSTFLYAQTGKILSTNDLQEIQKSFPKLLDKSFVTLVKGVDYGKFTQVEAESFTQRGSRKLEFFIVDSLKDVVFFGTAFKKDSTAIKLPKNKKIIEGGVAFKVGTGKENLYLVTDPECRYCTKLEKKITPEILKKYTINIILYPLSFHTNAKQMLYWVLSADSKSEQSTRLRQVLLGDVSYKKFIASKEQRKKADIILDNSKKAAKELNIRGTPSIFNARFEQIRGF